MKHSLRTITSFAWLLVSLASQESAPTTAPTAAPTTVRLHGRVLQWNGQPIAGAAVTCASKQDLDTAALLANPTATTDADGRFTLSTEAPHKNDKEARYLHVAAKGMASLLRTVAWKRSPAAAGAAAAAAAAGAGKPTDGEQSLSYDAETAIGDIALTTGQQLFGRVRDVDGKALAGVRVVATDMLERGNTFRSGAAQGFHCAAISDASGIFRLPCALPNAATLEFHAEGYHREWLQPVAAATPLETTLQRSGWIQGRVLDRDGHSISDAKVTVNYELRSGSRPVTTGPDGSFRVPVDRPGRWRITAEKRLDASRWTGHSDVMTGPRENLEVLVDGKEAEATQVFTVRAVAKDGAQDRAIIENFRAAALWEPYAKQNLSYRDYRFRLLMRTAQPSQDGIATATGPGKSGTTSGLLRVVAPGFAPATITDYEWKEPEAGKTAEPLLVELEAEATVAGIVRDERTGDPVAGAKVRAVIKPGPNEGFYPDESTDDAVTTAADGSFELKGLGEGAWQLQVTDTKHPKSPSVEVELAKAEHRTGLSITLPSGARVAGKLTGIEVGGGARVFLAQLPKQVFGNQNQGSYGYSSRTGREEDTSLPVAPDGSFAFDGIALENHQLVVRLPSQPRLGGDLYLPIEPFRVRAAGIDREFDCSADQPGVIRGKITFADADTTFDRLVVTAQVIASEQNQVFFSPYNQYYPGPRSFVDRSGVFEIRVGPGDYKLSVIDVTTSVMLHSEEKKVEVATGKQVDRDLALRLRKFDLVLQPASGVATMAVVERIEIRFVPKVMKENARAFAGNEDYDPGTGLDWPLGQERMSLVLPEGDATFLCRNNIAQIRIDDARRNNAPVGRAEFEVTLGEGGKSECTLEVGAPPETNPAKKDAKEDGTEPDKQSP